jgi:hypothetical protein
VATAFNWAYATNRDALVWQRWDPQSRAIISEHDYVTRHRDCNTAPGAATTLNVAPQGNHWLVTYAISGVNAVDTWYYIDGRWEFDLPASNPSAVTFYRLPIATYLKTLGCNH